MKMQQYIDDKLYDTPEEAARACLEDQLLGVVNRFNDMLQEVHVRPTTNDKCKTVRALGAVIGIAGHSVLEFAPQVRRTFFCSHFFVA